MGHSNFVQSSFLGGEWSPFTAGRIDRPDYKTGMTVCRNGFPLEEGAWVRRSGTRFAATTLNGGAGRVMKFDFEQNAPYLMEFTDGALRMFSVASQTGALATALPTDFRLVTTNDNQSVSSISTANPAVVQTASAHGWSSGDQVTFLFASVVAPTFTPLLRNRQFKITVVDTTHVSLTDPISGAAIDGSKIGWSSLGTGNVVIARVLKIATPYASGAWATLRKIQAETQAILLHGSYQPQQLSVSSLPTSSAFATFSLSAMSFQDGPYLDPPTDGSTLTPSGTSGTITLTASSASSINGGAGFKSTDIGRMVRLLSQPGTWASGTAYTVGQSVTYNGAYYTCTQANAGQEPDIAIAYWSINTSAAVWTWGTIASVASTTSCTLTISGINLLYTLPVVTWRLGVYSNTTGWPTCGVYYEGRLWLSGAVANRVDASTVNNLSVFSPTAADGTVADSNGISYTFNCEDVNPIYWMIGTSTGIICGTQAGEWVIQASQLSDPITPTSIQAHRVTKYGCANIEPEHTELTISYVHRYSRKILEYFPDVFSGRYTAPNLTQTAKHLTIPGIKEIRYQHELSPIIWGRCGDGSLIGGTYKRTSLFSSQGPEFMGWHRHDLGSGRSVQSITVGPSVDGTLDTLAMVTLDAATGVYHVELMNNVFDVGADIKTGWFVDDAVTPSGASITVSPSGNTITFYGLWHLNGKTVTVQCGGVDAGDATVANGAVTVSIDTDLSATFTTTYLASISSQTAYGAMTCPVQYQNQTYYVPAVIGFTFTSQGQTLRPDTADDVRSPTGPGSAKPSRIFQFGAMLSGAQGISFGTDFNKMHAANFRSPGGKSYSPLQLYTGVYWDTIEDNYSFESMIAWQISRPYPALVNYVTGFMETLER